MCCELCSLLGCGTTGGITLPEFVTTCSGTTAGTTGCGCSGSTGTVAGTSTTTCGCNGTTAGDTTTTCGCSCGCGCVWPGLCRCGTNCCT